MKELKDFLKEVEENSFEVSILDNQQGLITKSVLYTDEVKRLISEAYVAGINFQEAQKKGASNGGIQSKG